MNYDPNAKPVVRCNRCGKDQGSKFALKHHQRYCRQAPNPHDAAHYVNGRRV